MLVHQRVQSLHMMTWVTILFQGCGSHILSALVVLPKKWHANSLRLDEGIPADKMILAGFSQGAAAWK